jgi:hypothetical protein
VVSDVCIIRSAPAVYMHPPLLDAQQQHLSSLSPLPIFSIFSLSALLHSRSFNFSLFNLRQKIIVVILCYVLIPAQSSIIILHLAPEFKGAA